MRQPTKNEYMQLKRQGFCIVPICKAFNDRNTINQKFVMKNNTVIISPIKHEGICSLDYLYEKGILV